MSDRANRRSEMTFADPMAFVPQTSDVDTRQRWLPFHLVEPLAIGADLVVILLASIASGTAYQQIVLDGTGDVGTCMAIGGLVFVNLVALNSAQHNYRPTNLINAGRQWRYVTLNWLFIFSMLAAVAFALKISGTFSRGSTLSFFAVGWGSLLVLRLALARYLRRSLARGTFAQQKIALISERGQHATSRALAELSQCGYLPMHTVELTPQEIDYAGVAKSLRHKIENIIAASQNEGIEYIFLLLKWDQPHLINNIVRMLRALPIPVHLLPDENVAAFLSARNANIGRAFTIELQRAPLSAIEQMAKRSFDIVSAIIATVMLAPLMLITALLIKLDSPGPALFQQKRNGFNGRVFSIYKFRTMHVLEDSGPIRQATRNDPRVTRLGRWLRRTSIDELPQLLNVIRGEMSLVGPRPHAIAHNNEYQTLVANYAFRHHMKPGITGWAQVSGFRGETQTLDAMTKRVECDLWYINHWSLWLDLRIILKTLILAYRQPTAY